MFTCKPFKIEAKFYYLIIVLINLIFGLPFSVILVVWLCLTYLLTHLRNHFKIFSTVLLKYLSNFFGKQNLKKNTDKCNAYFTIVGS